MKNKIGVVTTTYPNYELEDALRGISQAGFKYVELTSAPAFFTHIIPNPEDMTEEDAQNILSLCQKYGLSVHCVAGHTRLMKENGVDNFKKVIDAAKAFGANHVTTDTGEVKDDKDRKRFFADMKEIGDYAKKMGITVCLEMHGEWLNNGSIGADIIEKIGHPNVKLNYDTANVMYYGAVKAEDDLENALPYLGFLHLKERAGGPKEWNFPAPGEGNLDFDRIFSLVKDYSGPISVEIEFDGSEKPLEEIDAAVKKAYNFLKEHNYL
ncbi:MAG: sugar phosphate isomerase/epimerase family protein [Actinomycetota bacterium]